MQTEKQNLISLSLAGSVGFYLYSKLAAVGMASAFGGGREPASERTRKELLITIEPEIVEPVIEEVPEVTEELFVEAEEPTIESPPEVVEDTVVDDILAAAEEDVEDVEVIAEQDVGVSDDNLIPALIVEEEVVEETVEEAVEEITENADAEVEIPNIAPDDTDVDVSLFDTTEETPIDNLFGAISENDAQIAAIPTVEEMVPAIVEDEAAPAVTENEVVEEPSLLDDITPITPDASFIEAPELDFSTPDLIEDIGAQPVSDLDTLETVEEVADSAPVADNDKSVAPPLVEDIFSDSNPDETVIAPIGTLDDIEEVATPVIDTPAAPVADEGKVMDNVEALHPIDKKAESAKEEYKSIMDFFSSL
jgi:hypothetical protein